MKHTLAKKNSRQQTEIKKEGEGEHGKDNETNFLGMEKELRTRLRMEVGKG